MKRSDHGQSEIWTTRRLLVWTSRFLAKKGVDSPRLSAEMLLAHVLGVPRLNLYMDSDRLATELERAAFRDLVERASAHEPVDYLTGQTNFFSLTLHVTPAVLIPRPSTETIVEHVMQHARRTSGFSTPLIFDIGTGSGAIAIALTKHLRNCHVIATDIREDVLAVAKENAQQQDVADRIEFVQGDLFDALQSDQRAQYLLANPPYVSDEQWAQVAPNVKNYEPELALRGGVDGLKFIRRIITDCRRHLDVPGQLVIEFGADQKEHVLQLSEKTPGLINTHILADHEGLARVLVANASSQ